MTARTAHRRADHCIFISPARTSFTAHPSADAARHELIMSRFMFLTVHPCHLLRHTAATGMLEGGADIRYVAELFGHARLETTQIYTRVSIDKLTEVHARTHPSARQA